MVVATVEVAVGTDAVGASIAQIYILPSGVVTEHGEANLGDLMNV